MTDNCDPAPTVTHSDSIQQAGDCKAQITIARTWTATDACGNKASADDDPKTHGSPLCDERLIDGTCCPAIAAPPPKVCPNPCAP